MQKLSYDRFLQMDVDATNREGTRAVGPLTAIWYMVFMVPFFLWVKDPKPKRAAPFGELKIIEFERSNVSNSGTRVKK